MKYDYNYRNNMNKYFRWMYVGIRADYSASYVIRANLDGTNLTILNLNSPIQFPLLEGLIINHQCKCPNILKDR